MTIVQLSLRFLLSVVVFSICTEKAYSFSLDHINLPAEVTTLMLEREKQDMVLSIIPESKGICLALTRERTDVTTVPPDLYFVRAGMLPLQRLEFFDAESMLIFNFMESTENITNLQLFSWVALFARRKPSVLLWRYYDFRDDSPLFEHYYKHQKETLSFDFPEVFRSTSAAESNEDGDFHIVESHSRSIVTDQLGKNFNDRPYQFGPLFEAPELPTFVFEKESKNYQILRIRANEMWIAFHSGHTFYFYELPESMILATVYFHNQIIFQGKFNDNEIFTWQQFEDSKSQIQINAARINEPFDIIATIRIFDKESLQEKTYDLKLFREGKGKLLPYWE